MLSIQQNVNLKPFNTFGIQAFAQYFTTITSIDQAIELVRSNVFKNEKHFIIGGGSNILLTKDYDGLIVKNELKGIEITYEDDRIVNVKVGAGENWHSFVVYCVDRNWGGVENLSLIPGTVGAAPMQNIGAYGVEVKKNILAVEAIEISSGEVRVFNNEQCKFGYRESIFKQSLKEKYIISSVTLTLTKKDHMLNLSYGAIEETLKQMSVTSPTIKNISDAVIHIRRSKLPDPTKIGNAGSFFKNPSIQADLYDFLKKDNPSLPSYPGENGFIKVPAGWLIEQCGWKGKTFNNIGVHKDQSLVLVNYGGGSGDELWQLAMKIRASVSEKYNITLQPEVNVI